MASPAMRLFFVSLCIFLPPPSNAFTFSLSASSKSSIGLESRVLPRKHGIHLHASVEDESETPSPYPFPLLAAVFAVLATGLSLVSLAGNQFGPLPEVLEAANTEPDSIQCTPETDDCKHLDNLVIKRNNAFILLEQQWGKRSTGNAVQQSAAVLSRYFEIGKGHLGGKRVIELGTGTGLASIGAHRSGAAEVLATDGDPEVLQLAARNVEANRLKFPLDVGRKIGVQKLEWGNAEQMAEVKKTKWDVVLGVNRCVCRLQMFPTSFQR
mmetsp:Transcript_28605/g.56022  ORF Transcript_28605/g.56022 Transcript_28605/m.56022 type:complete len:268 (-) Transcript_28605:1821-2624(-)